MTERIRRTDNVLTPEQLQRPGRNVGRRPQGVPFDEVLKRSLDKDQLRYSAHAMARMKSREISLTPGEQSRLERAVEKAAAKGARESLIIMDDLALVVSIRNRTVITALNGESMKENVFTNIDSAVIM
jgi:flagellar operon protein